MAEARRVRLPGHGLTLAGDAWGNPSAAPVVLLHGGGQTRHAWGGTAAALAERGWHAIALDLRGHGESEWAPDHDYRVDAYASDLRAVASAFGRPLAVVGASLGGMAALLAAGEPPAIDASAVVLVDIAPRTEPAGVQRIIAFMTANPDGFASLEEAADAVAAYLHHRPRPRDLAGLRKNLRHGDDGRYRWHWDPHMMTGDKRISATRNPERLETAAAAVRAPILLVRGRMSDVLSEAGARALLAVVPSACYVDVSGAGHMVAGDRNDRFTDAVVTFLADATGFRG
jgi:pimeloyl-ACP methyl ester carboxylesterase